MIKYIKLACILCLITHAWDLETAQGTSFTAFDQETCSGIEEISFCDETGKPIPLYTEASPLDHCKAWCDSTDHQFCEFGSADTGTKDGIYSYYKMAGKKLEGANKLLQIDGITLEEC